MCLGFRLRNSWPVMLGSGVRAVPVPATAPGRTGPARSSQSDSWELLGILAPKFSRDTEELAHSVFLADLAHYANPRRTLHVVEDEPDNRILECALTARADAIVTADHALLALRSYRGVHIISLREYWICKILS